MSHADPTWQSTVRTYIDNMNNDVPRQEKVQTILNVFNYLEQTLSIWKDLEKFVHTVYRKTIELECEPELSEAMKRFQTILFPTFDEDKRFTVTVDGYLEKIEKAWLKTDKIRYATQLFCFIRKNSDKLKEEPFRLLEKTIYRKMIQLRRTTDYSFSESSEFLAEMDGVMRVLYPHHWCKARTLKGEPCKKFTDKGMYCHVHEKTVGRVEGVIPRDIPSDLIDLIFRYGLWTSKLL